MDISPQAIASASFPVVKKGFDPDHVRSFLGEVGRALESAQNQSTAMEARARAAVAKLQELTQATAKAPEQQSISNDDAEAISRTLLLAQKAADTTIAEARQEADTMVSAARAEAATVLSDARRQSTIVLEDARAEARRASEAERQRVESEVQALLARREFLLSDVEHLEEFVATQRRRVQDVAALLAEVAERGPGGLGDVRRPLLSAADAAGSPGTTSTVAAAADDLHVAVPAESPVEVVSEPVAVPSDLLDGGRVAAADTAMFDTGEMPAVAGSFGADPADDLGVGLFDDEATGETELDDTVFEFTESAQTPTQSPALLDFDSLDATSEIPVVPPSDRG